MKLFLRAILFLLLPLTHLAAHPMPNSVLLLDVKSDGISAELQWPLKEFQLVYPNIDLDTNANTLIQRQGKWLDDYLLSHMSVTDSYGHNWAIIIKNKTVTKDEQSMTGRYNELVFQLWLQPPAGVSPRHFIMHYDAIMHQLVTHKMLVRIRQDWDGGLTSADSTDAELGVLMANPADYKVPPLIVNLDEGSKWKGFKSMVSLGMQHISEGTDHLLFLLVLLLPAPLLVRNRRWSGFGGTRYSIIRLLKIVTAFTIGHSITLALGALGWLHLPGRPIEVLIAFSILITAIHALRPMFPGNEMYIAAGFGLIHGMAFAATLAGLQLQPRRMALSLLGFNIGIELMQLFVILLVMPWLVILARYSDYRYLRITGAICAALAAMSWMAERITQHPNFLTPYTNSIASHAQWLVLTIAALAIITYVVKEKKTSNN